jgi:hypothetical protein
MDTQLQNKMADTTQITIVFSDTNGPDKNEQSGYRIFRKLGSDPFPDNILVEDPLPTGVEIVKSHGNTRWTESDYDELTDNNNTPSTGDITFNDNVVPGVSYFYRIEFYRNSTRESAISDAVGPLQGYTSNGLAYPGGALNYDPSSDIEWGNSYCSVAPLMHIDATFEYSKYGGDYSYSGGYRKNPESSWSTGNVEYAKTADQFENLVRDINLPLEAHYSQLVNWQTPLNGDGIPVIVQKYILGANGTNSLRLGKQQTLTGLFNKYFNDKNTSDFIVEGLSDKAPALFLDKGFTAIIVVPGSRPYTQLDSDKIDAFESIQTWSSGTDYEESIYVKARDSDNRWGYYQKKSTTDNPNTLNPSENSSDWKYMNRITEYNPITIGQMNTNYLQHTFPLATTFFDSGYPCRLNTDSWKHWSYKNLNINNLPVTVNETNVQDVIDAEVRQKIDEARSFEYYRFSDGNRLKFRKNDHFYFNNLGINGSTEAPGRKFDYVGPFGAASMTVTDLNGPHPFFGGVRDTHFWATKRSEWHDGRNFWFNSFSYQKEGYFKDLIFKTDDDVEKYTKGPKELSVNSLISSKFDYYSELKHAFNWGNGVGLTHYHGIVSPYMSVSYFENGQSGAFYPNNHLSHNMGGDQFTPAIWTHASITPQGKFMSVATEIQDESKEQLYTTSTNAYNGGFNYFPEDRQVGWSGGFPTHCGCVYQSLNYIQDFWSDLDEESFTYFSGRPVGQHTGGSNSSYTFTGWLDYLAAIRDDAPTVTDHKAYEYCKTSHIYVVSMRINQDPDGGPNQFTAYLNGKPFLNFYDYYLGFPSTHGASGGMAGVGGMSAPQAAYGRYNLKNEYDCRDKDNYVVSCSSSFTTNTKAGELNSENFNGVTKPDGSLITNTGMQEGRHPIYLPGGPAYNYAASFKMPTQSKGMSMINAGFQPGGCRVTPGFHASQVVPFQAPVLGFSELFFFPELLDYSDLKRVVGYLQTKYDDKLYPQQDLYHLGYTYQDNWSNNTAVNDNIIYGSQSDPFKLSKFQQTYTIQTSHSPVSGNFYGDGGAINTTIGGWDFRFDDADPKPYPLKYLRGGKRNESGKSNPQPIFR